MFGHVPDTPSMRKASVPFNTRTVIDHAIERERERASLFKLLRKRLIEKQLKREEHFNTHAFAAFQPGDQVFVKVQTPAIHKKLMPTYTSDKEGLPYIVHESGGAYVILYDRSAHQLFYEHVGNIRFYAKGKVSPNPLSKGYFVPESEKYLEFLDTKFRGGTLSHRIPLQRSKSNLDQNSPNIPFRTFRKHSKPKPKIEPSFPFRPRRSERVRQKAPAIYPSDKKHPQFIRLTTTTQTKMLISLHYHQADLQHRQAIQVYALRFFQEVRRHLNLALTHLLHPNHAQTKRTFLGLLDNLIDETQVEIYILEKEILMCAPTTLRPLTNRQMKEADLDQTLAYGISHKYHQVFRIMMVDEDRTIRTSTIRLLSLLQIGKIQNFPSPFMTILKIFHNKPNINKNFPAAYGPPEIEFLPDSSKSSNEENARAAAEADTTPAGQKKLKDIIRKQNEVTGRRPRKKLELAKRRN